jgi:hypothetical protein
VNLSCGKCKAIRNFSGDPPKCDVCGWAVGSSDPPVKTYGLAAGVTNLGRGVIKAVRLGLLVVLIGSAVWYIAYEVLTPLKQKLADQYHVSQDQVFIEQKPHGCDFDDARLGNKHCHFEKRVDAAKPCVGCPVTAVYVSWRKVEE